MKKTWICPYCESEVVDGVCTGCKARLSPSELIFGEPQAPQVVVNTDFSNPQAEKKESKLSELVRKNIDTFAPHEACGLGKAYFAGMGVETDYELAYKLFFSAARRGEKEALFYLGECYREGKGVEKDDEKAKSYYLEGASKGVEGCADTLKLIYGISAVGGVFFADKEGGDFVQLVDKLYTNVAELHASGSADMKTSAGSGAIIADDYVVTNAHVILSESGSPYDNIYVCVGDDSRRYGVKVEAFSASEDVAVLTFTGEKPPLIYGARLILRPAKTAKVGEDVFTIGNPNNMGLSVSKGIISRAAECDGCDRLVLRTDMTINHGNSGGPLFDRSGYVLGLMTYSISESGGEKLGDMSFAVASETILDIIKKIK